MWAQRSGTGCPFERFIPGKRVLQRRRFPVVLRDARSAAAKWGFVAGCILLWWRGGDVPFSSDSQYFHGCVFVVAFNLLVPFGHHPWCFPSGWRYPVAQQEPLTARGWNACECPNPRMLLIWASLGLLKMRVKLQGPMICVDLPVWRFLDSGLMRYWILSMISYSILQYPFLYLFCKIL